jgi:hypothetical protein
MRDKDAVQQKIVSSDKGIDMTVIRVCKEPKTRQEKEGHRMLENRKIDSWLPNSHVRDRVDS